MKDADLKQLLSEAYASEKTDKQRSFIRQYKRRELRFSELLRIQLKYMWPQMLVILLFLIGSLAYLAFFTEEESVHLISSIMPLPAVIALSGLGKAARYGMNELEMTTRFSARMLKSIRLVLIENAGLVSVAAVTVMLAFGSGISVSRAVLVSAFPYMITTVACMIIIRKWHAKENIFACFAVALTVSLLSMFRFAAYIWRVLQISDTAGFILLVIISFIMVKEARHYIRESEEIQWNLC